MALKSYLDSGVMYLPLLLELIISLYSLADKQAAGGIDPVLYVWFTDTVCGFAVSSITKEKIKITLSYFSSNFRKLSNTWPFSVLILRYRDLCLLNYISCPMPALSEKLARFLVQYLQKYT
jgi:hypothetical protein